MRGGSGPPLVKAANWLTHLQYDAESPIWAHWVGFLEGHFDYLRYDERGCGLSDTALGGLKLDDWVADLRAVIEASDIPRPFALLGMSQGAATATAYAARYPEDVSHLILAGGFSRGSFCRDDPEQSTLYRAVIEVFRLGFTQSNRAFTDVFTSRFAPAADSAKRDWFSDLCRRTTTPDVGAELLLARGHMNSSPELSRITAPTLILHARDDQVVPLGESALMSREIPGAEFIVLDSPNHVLQADEPAWASFTEHLLSFTGNAPQTSISSLAQYNLTDREAAILRLICDAKSNKQIARDLDVSEKTVRNHATNIFAKLGVTTRAEAMLRATQKG
jgi:pimeloyl-ACP methyl ester carboxylesterase